MGLFDKLEQRLERGVNTAFARAFRSEVQPVELASAVRRAMDDRATSAGKNKRQIVPNLFDIELSPTDYDQLREHGHALTDELKASAAEHAETQRYTPGGPLTINFSENDRLETGVFTVRPSVARQAGQPAQDPAPARPQPPAGARPLPHQRGEQHQQPAYDAGYDEPRDWRTQGQQHEPYRADEQYESHHAAPLDPSPAAPRSYRQRPCLEIDGQEYPLVGAINVIGRDDDVDIVLDDTGISRRHSEIRVTNDGPHLVASVSDLGSTNGTYVNGGRITSVHLRDGDRITIGRTSFTFRQGPHR